MSDLLEIKKIIEAQGSAWEEYRNTNDALLKAKAEGKAVADLEAKLDKISTDLDRMGELKGDLDRALVKLQRPALGDDKTATDLAAETKSFNMIRNAFTQGVGDVSSETYLAYKGAFFQLMRKGNMDFLTDIERKAMVAGTDSDGGYLLPPTTTGRIVQKVYELSPIRPIVTVQPISTEALEGIIDNDEAASGGWVSETGTRGDTNTPTLGKWRIEAHEMFAQPKATQKLLDDAAVDVEAWLANKVADKLARVEAAAFITGTGVGQPRGFTSYTTAATSDATRAWGQIEHVNTGANGAFHTTGADPLFDLIGAFKNYYLQNAKWVTRREVITAVRKLKEATTNAYMWQPGLQLGQPDRLLGYPLVIAQDMPALATGSLSMAFGDFAEAYTIVDRIGLRTLRDPYTDKPYIKFYTTRRVGGGMVNYEAIKFVRFSA